MPPEAAPAPAVTPKMSDVVNAPPEKPPAAIDPAVARDLALENASKADRDARRRQKEADKAALAAADQVKAADERFAPLKPAIEARDKGDLKGAIKAFLGEKYSPEALIYLATDDLPEEGAENPEEPFEDRVSKVVEAREAKREADRVAAEKVEQEREQAEAMGMLDRHIGEAREYLKTKRDDYPLLKKWSKDPDYDIEVDYRRNMVALIDGKPGPDGVAVAPLGRAPKPEEVFARMEAGRKAKGAYYEPERPAEVKKSWRDELAEQDEAAWRDQSTNKGPDRGAQDPKESPFERERRKLQEMEAEERGRAGLMFRRGA